MPQESYLRLYQANDIIFQEGSEGQQFFIVISGRVAIRKSVAGLTQTVRVLGPGEFFGELSVIDAVPRSAEAVALEIGTKVMEVDKARFLYLVSQQPGFAVMIMETLSRWLRGSGPAINQPSSTERLTRPAHAAGAFTVVPITDDVYQFRSRTRSCNAFLFKGRRRNVLIDAGLGSSFESLSACLGSLGLSPSDVDTIVLTHEHFDHVAAVAHFCGTAQVAAHRLAANKLVNHDAFAIMQGSFTESSVEFGVDWILNESTVIDTGSHRLRVYHTPGHTSGCISLVEAERGLLVSGDMVMAGGPMGGVFGSGNISDTIYSLELLADLHVKQLLPGHGPISNAPDRDIQITLDRSRALLADTRIVFETLNGRDSINKILLAVRDLNR